MAMSIAVKSGQASAFQPFLDVRGDVLFRLEARKVQPGPHQPGDQRPADFGPLDLGPRLRPDFKTKAIQEVHLARRKDDRQLVCLTSELSDFATHFTY